jgi:hypothetical protein
LERKGLREEEEGMEVIIGGKEEDGRGWKSPKIV